MLCCDCQTKQPSSAFPALVGKPGYEKAKKDRCFSCERKRRNVLWSRRYGTIEGRAKWMLQNAQARAKARSIPYTLTLEWAVEKLTAGTCEATGIQFNFSTEEVDLRLGEWAPPLAPSIERKDPHGGYTPANCEIILWVLNRAKANFNRQLFDAVMVEYVKRIK